VWVLAIFVASASACAPLRQSSGARDAIPSPERRADPYAAPWVVRDAGARRSQLVEVRALLTSLVDSFVRVDTLHSVLEFAWSSVPETSPPRVAGMVTDARVSLGADSLAPPAGLSLPFSFTSEIRTPGTQPLFLVPDGGACNSPAAALVHGVRESWISLPDTLWLERGWRDSVSYSTCRDGVVLTLDVVREFAPTGARLRDGQLVVLITRRSRSLVRGEGTQFGEEISITGEGEGEMLLEVALAAGAILTAEGTSELRLEMRGRRRTQRLVQESRIVVREP
jgi:hypothetical protein